MLAAGSFGLLTGLTAQDVPLSAAHQLTSLPPTAVMFAERGQGRSLGAFLRLAGGCPALA